MEIHELIVELKLLERRLTLYEEKYYVLSEDFYNPLMDGELSQYDAYDEIRADFRGALWRLSPNLYLTSTNLYLKRLRLGNLFFSMRLFFR